MSETKHTCCDQIRGGKIGLRLSWRACGKTARIEREGKWYCGIHDPVRRKEKLDATHAKWQEESHARSKENRIRAALAKAEDRT